MSIAPNRNILITVVMPVTEVEPNLKQSVATVEAILKDHYSYFEIILVDDTNLMMNKVALKQVVESCENIRALCFSRPFGREVAIFAGMEAAIGDFVVVMGTNEPADMLPALLKQVQTQSMEVLFGQNHKAKPASGLNKLSRDLFLTFCKKWMKLDFDNFDSRYIILTRHVLNAILRIRDRRRLLQLSLSDMGIPYGTFAYESMVKDESLHDKGFAYFGRLVLDIMASTSIHPLKWVVRLCVGFSCINVLYSGYVLGVNLFLKGVASGWTTLSLQISGLFFFMFLLVAILFEYIGRIAHELYKRPHYYISSEMVSSTHLNSKNINNVVANDLAS